MMYKFGITDQSSRRIYSGQRHHLNLAFGTMVSPSHIIDERMPVWTALSELFLDTQLQKEDHQRIAKILAMSPYSETKLEEILRQEVSPLLQSNLLGVAGEWVGFDETWLRAKLTPRIDRRSSLLRRIFGTTPDDWRYISPLIAQLRVNKET